MNANRPATIKIGEHTISNSYYEKLLGVKIDSQLKFDNHLERIIKKASREVYVLVRITPSMCISKRKLKFEMYFSDNVSYVVLAENLMLSV